MTNQQIIDKHLSRFFEIHGKTIPIEFNYYMQDMLNDARYPEPSKEVKNRITMFKKITTKYSPMNTVQGKTIRYYLFGVLVWIYREIEIES